MFGTLVVFYLFLGGAGAGAVAICSVLDLVWVKQPFGTSAYRPGPSVCSAGRLLDYGLLAGFACLIVGVLCLVFDLGRTDRIISLLLSPSATWLSVGSFALIGLAALSGFLVLVRYVYLPDVPRSVVVVAEALAGAVAVLVMLYTGFLLQSVEGVALWSSPLVPALFLLSSLSSGVALLFVCGLFVDLDRRCAHLLRGLARADVVLVLLEAVCAAVFLAGAAGSGHPGVAESFARLVSGEAALIWWLGFCLCGIAAPLVLEAVGIRSRIGLQMVLAVAAVFVLAGAFGLRWSIVEAGVHREPVLEAPFLQDGEMLQGFRSAEISTDFVVSYTRTDKNTDA